MKPGFGCLCGQGGESLKVECGSIPVGSLSDGLPSTPLGCEKESGKGNEDWKSEEHLWDKEVEARKAVAELEETRRGIAQQQEEWLEFLRNQVLGGSVLMAFALLAMWSLINCDLFSLTIRGR